MSKRTKEEQFDLPGVGPEIGKVLRGYSFKELDTMVTELRTEIAESASQIIAHLDTLCRLAPGSQEAAFAAIMVTLPRESRLRSKVKSLRTLTLYIAARERAAIGGGEPSPAPQLDPEPQPEQTSFA